MDEVSVVGINGAVFPEDPGVIYLRGSDIIAMARSNAQHYDELTDKQDASTENGLLYKSALVAAGQVLHVVADELELLCMEMATDVADLLDGGTDG